MAGRILRRSRRATTSDVAGIGGTLTGNALSLAAVRATLGHGADRRGLRRGTSRWPSGGTAGVQAVIDRTGAVDVQRLGCRAEYWFCPPPRNGGEAARRATHELDAFLHL